MENHPAASASVAARNFLDEAATPPCGRARRGITLDSNLFTAPQTAPTVKNLYAYLAVHAEGGIRTFRPLDPSASYAFHERIQRTQRSESRIRGTREERVQDDFGNDQLSCCWRISRAVQVSHHSRWQLLRGDWGISGGFHQFRVFTNEPRYLIRAIPPSSAEVIFGERLGALAVDAGMSGYSD